tara:strand:+ start:1910 stop:2443 length:534 start_codon:yes stop_codon:yes gene_type:complete
MRKKVISYQTNNLLKATEISFIDKEMGGNNFPWYFQPISTSEKFSFFSHGLIGRYNHKEDMKINSSHFDFCNNIFKRFCVKHNIKVNRLLRGCINLTYHHANYEHADPHIDHSFKHMAFILYLNDCSGDTLFFKDGNIIKRVHPKKGKAICYDGSHLHTAAFCDPGEIRKVLIFTFI